MSQVRMELTRPRRVALVALWLLVAAGCPAWAQERLTTAALDSLQAAAADTFAAASPDSLPVPVALALPRVRDFFDTGVNGTAAVLMTPVFPGWGQLYAGGGWRAMLAFGAEWFFWSHMLEADRNGARYRDHARTLPRENTDRRLWDDQADLRYDAYLDFAWWSGGILLIVAVDAYVGAGLYNFDEEPVPVPDRFDQYFPDAAPQPIGSTGAPTYIMAQWGWRF
ncbi:MAG: DUF5683 domain-containing protein [Candidatus Krumholzibacteriia bacterium]